MKYPAIVIEVEPRQFREAPEGEETNVVPVRCFVDGAEWPIMEARVDAKAHRPAVVTLMFRPGSLVIREASDTVADERRGAGAAEGGDRPAGSVGQAPSRSDRAEPGEAGV